MSREVPLCSTCAPVLQRPALEVLCPHGCRLRLSKDAPTEQDWAALLRLAETGMYECPWGWESGTVREFPGWGRAEFQAALDRCAAYLKERG